MTRSPLSDQQLACLPIAYGTAMECERAHLTAEETVLITGLRRRRLALVQLAAARVTYVIPRPPGQGEHVARTGAHVVVRRDATDPLAAIHRAAPMNSTWWPTWSAAPP